MKEIHVKNTIIINNGRNLNTITLKKLNLLQKNALNFTEPIFKNYSQLKGRF